MASKNLEVMGRPATFFGREGDDYFDRLDAYAAQNALLIEELVKLAPDANVIDVGANIGVTAVMCSRAVGNGKVVAIEPSPVAYRDLTQSLRASGAENCEAIRACVGREEGSVPFQEANFLGGFMARMRGSRTIDVPLMTLDKIVEDRGWSRLDLVKIDVDGPELDVLAGGRKTFKRLRPKIVLEFSAYTLSWYGNISPRAPLDFILAEFGSFEYVRDGVRKRVASEEDAKHFLFNSMVMSAVLVDDLVFGGPATG